MGFDLLANPFAILRLANSATIAAITARAREIGSGEASEASRLLLSPRTRLPAELAFLPEATQDQVNACLHALKSAVEPELWPLSLVGRANVLAHLASAGQVQASHLRDLVGMQEAIPAVAQATVDAGRANAKMPPVPPDMMGAALQHLTAQYSEAFVSGAMALEDGAEFLSNLVSESGKDVTPRVIFLRQCAAGWERATARKLFDYMELADPLEGKLKLSPDVPTALQLSGLIAQYALTSRPQRDTARMLGLEHEPSAQAIRRWQTVALDLNNRLDAIPEAVTVFEALESGFGTGEELGKQVARNLSICRDRLAAGDGSPEMKRLSQAVDRATSDAGEFDNSDMDNGRPTPKSPNIVVELHDAFVAAATVSASDRPWLLLRAFSLRLHNDHSSTRAAWNLTELAVRQANLNPSAAAMLPMLLEDRRSLREQVLRAEFETAVSAKKRSRMRQILTDLIPVAENATRRKDYESTLSKLQRQATFQFLKWGFWGFVGLATVIGIATSDKRPSQYPTQATAFQGTSNFSIPVPAAPAPDVSGEAIQPIPGTATVSLAGLRWCRSQKVRVNSAEAFVEKLRSAPGTREANFNAAVAAFNAYIRPFNASCGSYSYRKSDAAIVDAELSQHNETLEEDGRVFVLNAYSAATLAPAQVLATPPAYQPPTAYVARPAPVAPQPASASPYVSPPSWVPQPSQADPRTVGSAAYGAGQADRRAWEAWIGSVTGAIHDGAEWWAGVRSLAHPPTCNAVPGGIDPPAAASGCNQAKTRLVRTDARRRAEPDYRAGWNNP